MTDWEMILYILFGSIIWCTIEDLLYIRALRKRENRYVGPRRTRASKESEGS